MTKSQNLKDGRREIPVKEVKAFTIDGDKRLRQRIAGKAYELYQCHGCCDGRDLDDWLEAERMVSADCDSQGQSEGLKN